MNIPLGNIVSVSDVQKDYRKVFDKAKKTKEPVMVMRGNKPDVAILGIKAFDEMEKKLEEVEMAEAMEAIKIAEKEEKSGKLKPLRPGDLAKIAQS